MELQNFPVKCRFVWILPSVIVILSSCCSFVNPEEAGIDYILLGNHTSHGKLWLYKGPATWNDAQSQCRKKGADLVAITDRDLQEVVMQGFQENTLYDFLDNPWIGAKRVDGQHGWKWLGRVEDETIRVSAAEYFCAYMTWQGDYNHYYRADSMCDEKKRYICGMSNCHGSPGCYEVSAEDDMLTYDEAASACRGKGKTLVTFMSLKDENGANKDISITRETIGDIQPANYWIGLQYVAWQWTSKDLVTYTQKHFKIRESEKDPEAGCLEVRQAGHWQPKDCSTETLYICQLKGDGAWFTLANFFSSSKGQTVLIVGIVVIVLIIFFIACAIKWHGKTVEGIWEINDARDRKERRKDYDVVYSDKKSKKCSIEEV